MFIVNICSAEVNESLDVPNRIIRGSYFTILVDGSINLELRKNKIKLQ